MRIIFLFLTGTWLTITSCSQAQEAVDQLTNTVVGENNPDTLAVYTRLNEKVLTLKSYLQKNPSYNQRQVILIDMRQNSGKYRLFVYDMDSMKIISKGLVAHGSGSETGVSDSLTFSNTPESYMSSLGKYKIGNAYTGSFGRSYKLHGLDKSNSKAFDRAIVLHRYSCVPDNEQSYEICNSLGCPMVSENYFEELDKIVRSSGKPMIMEIYY
jgi:hypothetical protein